MFFNRKATLAYQQNMLVLDYMYNAKDRTSNDNLLWFFNYDQLTDWNNSYLENNYTKVDSSNINNFTLVDNASKLNSSYDEKVTYKQYPSMEMISNINKKYENDTNNKFDLWIVDGSLEDNLWIVDGSLEDMWKEASEKKSADFYNFFKKINKIYVITDGNYQTYYFINNALNVINKTGYKQLSQSEIQTQFNEYVNDTNNSKINDFYQYGLYDYIHYGNMFTFFHTQSYTDATSYYKLNTGIELYKTYPINYNYYQMAQTLFPDKGEKFNKFINDYEMFFNLENLKSLNDFFWKGFDNYDPKKKNIIWIGDSLILGDYNVYPQKTKEMKNILNSWMKKFPSSEYNWIAKFHPAYNEKAQQEYVEWLLGDSSQWIFSKNVPWELFLSWDYKNQIVSQDYVPFFSATSNSGELAKTKLVGFQYTSTTIQTTAFFLSNNYNVSLDDIDKSLSSKDFCVPETFDVVSRTTWFDKDIKKQYDENVKKIKNIYEPFVINKTYPEYKTNLVSATNYIKENYDANYDVFSTDDNSNSGNNGLSNVNQTFNWIIAVISIFSALFIIAIVLLVLSVNKKNNNK